MLFWSFICCRTLIRKMTASSGTFTVQANIERGIYSIMSVPRVLVTDHSGVYVHKSGPNQDEIKSLEKLDFEANKLLTPKLNGTSFGDYKLIVGMISKKHFDSREKVDALFSQYYTDDLEEETPLPKVDRISLGEALEFLTVSLSCNIDYYLSNPDEMEKDLDRKLEDLDRNNEEMMSELEAELLYMQSVKIFGEEGADEDVVTTEETADDQKICQRVLTFREFHLLFQDGNNSLATARRGSRYVLFFYRTS